MKQFVSATLLCLSIVILHSNSSPVSAQDTPEGALEVSPAFIEVTLDSPEQIKDIEISYTNHSDEFVSLQVYPVDFKQKDETGAISFLGQEAGTYSYSLSSFLSLESQSVELAPQEKKTFVVTVQNRQDLSPGGHYAAIIARLIPNEEGGQAPVAPSVSSLILLRKVGGERFHLSLKDLNWPDTLVAFSYPRSITMLFQNEGNIHMVPYGRVEVRDIFGRLTHDGNINASSLRVFPSSRRYIDAPVTRLSSSLPVMVHTVSVTGNDSLKKTNFVYRESFIYVNPVFLVILVVITGLLIYLQKKRRGSKLKSQHAKVQLKSQKQDTTQPLPTKGRRFVSHSKKKK